MTITVSLPLLLSVEGILVMLFTFMIVRTHYARRVARYKSLYIEELERRQDEACTGLGCKRRQEDDTVGVAAKRYERLSELEGLISLHMPTPWVSLFRAMKSSRNPAKIFAGSKLREMPRLTTVNRDLLANAFALIDGRTDVEDEYSNKMDWAS